MTSHKSRHELWTFWRLPTCSRCSYVNYLNFGISMPIMLTEEDEFHQICFLITSGESWCWKHWKCISFIFFLDLHQVEDEKIENEKCKASISLLSVSPQFLGSLYIQYAKCQSLLWWLCNQSLYIKRGCACVRPPII